jgi:hypothetical protein
LIYKDFLTLRKNMADGCFYPVLRLSAGLSTALVGNATDKFLLSSTSAHFVWIRLLARKRLANQALDLQGLNCHAQK